MTEHSIESVLVHFGDMTSLLAMLKDIKCSIEVIQRDVAELKTRNQLTPIKEYINREQASNLIGVSEVTIDAYKNLGILKAYSIGRRVRYLRHEVLDAPVPIVINKVDRDKNRKKK